MSNLVTDLKALQEETLLNLQSSKSINTVRAYKSDLIILEYFVHKMDLNLYRLNPR